MSFQDLPPEIWFKILSENDGKSILNVRLCSKHINNLVQDPKLWEQKIDREFKLRKQLPDRFYSPKGYVALLNAESINSYFWGESIKQENYWIYWTILYLVKFDFGEVCVVLEREIAIPESTPSSFFQAIFNLNIFTSIIENYIWCLQRILPDLEDSKIWNKIINPISEYEKHLNLFEEISFEKSCSKSEEEIRNLVFESCEEDVVKYKFWYWEQGGWCSAEY